MKKKIRFIINPISGVGRQKLAEKAIARYFDFSSFESDVVYTDRAGHSRDLVSDAVREKINVVVAVGGDGSINEIGGALLHSDTILAVLPCGSGNGFAGHLGIPKNLKRAIKVINRFNVSRIDTISVNDQTIVNIGGIGFDALVSYDFSKGSRRGARGYIKAIAKQLFSYKVRECILEVNGEERHISPLLIAIANASQYGNGAYVNPTGKIDDGYFELCILHKFPKISFIFLLILLFVKKIHLSKYMEVIKTKECKIIQKDILFHCDGEWMKMGNELNVRINPLSLQVVSV
jgi:diacylglycerol kinase (ATP)